MHNLDFKSWVEEMDATAVGAAPAEMDPTLAPIIKKAQGAMKTAIGKKQNPIAAAQQAVATSNVPLQKLGKIMPKDDDAVKTPGM